MAKYILLIGVSLFVLVACSTEKNYRGVSDTEWQQLSVEQRQLIVDRSFQDEMKYNKFYPQ